MCCEPLSWLSCTNTCLAGLGGSLSQRPASARRENRTFCYLPIDCLWNAFLRVFCALRQLLGPEPVDVAVFPYLKQVLDAVADMHFGLVSRMQWYFHHFAVFHEYFDPLDVVFLFHGVWNRSDFDYSSALCLFDNRQVLLVSYLSGFCDHLCHWLPAADKFAHTLMTYFNDVAADFALVDFVLLCHSATSLSFRKLLDRSRPSTSIVSPLSVAARPNAA